MQRSSRPRVIGMLLLTWLAGRGGVGHADVLYVANNGVDHPGCGDRTTPCRSLSQGLAQAVAHDTLFVGPGRYGDLDGDGLLTGEGEEHGTDSGNCHCMISITKPVRLFSQMGAEATIVDAGGAMLAAVSIDASEVLSGDDPLT